MRKLRGKIAFKPTPPPLPQTPHPEGQDRGPLEWRWQDSIGARAGGTRGPETGLHFPIMCSHSLGPLTVYCGDSATWEQSRNWKRPQGKKEVEEKESRPERGFSRMGKSPAPISSEICCPYFTTPGTSVLPAF